MITSSRMGLQCGHLLRVDGHSCQDILARIYAIFQCGVHFEGKGGLDWGPPGILQKNGVIWPSGWLEQNERPYWWGEDVLTRVCLSSSIAQLYDATCTYDVYKHLYTHVYMYKTISTAVHVNKPKEGLAVLHFLYKFMYTECDAYTCCCMQRSVAGQLLLGAAGADQICAAMDNKTT